MPVLSTRARRAHRLRNIATALMLRGGSYARARRAVFLALVLESNASKSLVQELRKRSRRETALAKQEADEVPQDLSNPFGERTLYHVPGVDVGYHQPCSFAGIVR
jgi:hypothetical protein